MLTKEDAKYRALLTAQMLHHSIAAIYRLNEGWHFLTHVDELFIALYVSTVSQEVEYCECVCGRAITDWQTFEYKGIAA